METSIVNCAIIGHGYWGRIVEKYILKHPGFNLIDIYTSSSLGSVDDFVSSTNANAYFICSPKSTHYDYCKYLLLRGKDVFCEKPLVSDIDMAIELYRIAECKESILFVDYVYTYSETVEKLKESLSNQSKILSIEMGMEQFGRFYSDSDVMETLGVHLLAILEALFPFFNYSIKCVYGFSTKISDNPTEKVIVLDINDIPVFLRMTLNSEMKKRYIRILTPDKLLFANMVDSYSTCYFEKNETGYNTNTQTLNLLEDNNLLKVTDEFYKAIISRSNVTNKRIGYKVEKILSDIKLYNR